MKMFRTESIKAEVEEMKKHNELLSEVAMELNSRGKRIEELEKEVKKLQKQNKELKKMIMQKRTCDNCEYNGGNDCWSCEEKTLSNFKRREIKEV